MLALNPVSPLVVSHFESVASPNLLMEPSINPDPRRR
jgi:hypothetical protein